MGKGTARCLIFLLSVMVPICSPVVAAELEAIETRQTPKSEGMQVETPEEMQVEAEEPEAAAPEDAAEYSLETSEVQVATWNPTCECECACNDPMLTETVSVTCPPGGCAFLTAVRAPLLTLLWSAAGFSGIVFGWDKEEGVRPSKPCWCGGSCRGRSMQGRG